MGSIGCARTLLPGALSFPWSLWETSWPVVSVGGSISPLREGWEVGLLPPSLTGLCFTLRVPEHRGPGCQGQLWAAGPDPGAALGQ